MSEKNEPPAGPGPEPITWVLTASGRAVDLLNPDPAQICIGDIALGLARICRFNGALSAGTINTEALGAGALGAKPLGTGEHGALTGTDRGDLPHYSVAQHSLIVSALVACHGPAVAQYGLLHDAHEYLTGDLVTPFKNALGEDSQDDIKAMQSRCDKAIFTALGLPWPMPSGIAEVIKGADRLALHIERNSLMRDSGPDWGLGHDVGLRVRTMTAGAAWAVFLVRFDENQEAMKVKASVFSGPLDHSNVVELSGSEK